MRTTLLSTWPLLVGAAGPVAAQSGHGTPPAARGAVQAAADRRPGDAALIANALSAAPASVSANATVMGHDGRVLRQGTGDWVCMPDLPDVPNDTPMCLDAPWRELIDAWMHKRAPAVTRIGFGYMLQGDMPVSNTDPFATAPSPGNQWIQDGAPHVMIVLPDLRLLDGVSSDPKNGGPFVMWKGTPYAHIMVPTTRAPR